MSISREMLVALGIGVFIISGSLYVNASDTKIEGTVTVAETNKAPERQYIKPADDNNNGISDWAEELLADREIFIEEVNPEKPYELPTSFTGQFSLKFFQDYLISKGLSEELGGSKEELIERSIASLDEAAKDRLYTFTDILISEDNSIEAIHNYGNKIAAIVLDSPNMEENEVDIYKSAINQKNPDRLADLDPIVEAYRDYLNKTIEVEVPSSLVNEHVGLVNVYAAILKDLVAMRETFEDPLLGLLRYKRYSEDVEGMVYVYFSLDRELRRAGIIFEEDEPGYAFNQLSLFKELIQ